MAEKLPSRAYRLLEKFAAADGTAASSADGDTVALLLAADLLEQTSSEALRLTGAGRSALARHRASHAGAAGIEPFRAQHLHPGRAVVLRPEGAQTVKVDQAESPLAWLARRKGKDGRSLIAPEQFLAGERLRAEFTRAEMMPRVTSHWGAPTGAGVRRGAEAASPADAVIAARQRVRRALDAAGPEFAGLLLDVCCFLKGLDEVERERRWPARSAKVVLQLGLDRLARHYGLDGEARGPDAKPMQTWLAPGAEFSVEDY